MDVDGGGGLGRRGLSKFTEILRRPRGEADVRTSACIYMKINDYLEECAPL